MASQKAASPDRPQMIQHVVSSPEALLSQLELVKLSEADTEKLLDEAYALNKILKEELRRQENEDALNNPNHRPSAASSSRRRPQRLPPLQSSGLDSRVPRSAVDLYSRPSAKTSPKHSRSAVGGFHSRGKSASSASHVASEPGTTSPKRSQTKSSARKSRKMPEWDDRFSYS